MSLIYKAGMYNQEIKEQFLSQMEETSQKTVSYVFYKTSEVEQFYDKDLFSFSLQQIEKVMKTLNPGSINKARSDMMNLQNYITWAIRKGYRESNIHPMAGTDSKWASQFIDNTTKRHYSEEEIDEIVKDLNNAQDQALIQCLFEGIMGKGLSELLSMNYNWIDWNENLITVKDDKDGEERTLKVSDKCMRYIKNAHLQQTYTGYGDEARELPLGETDYIFKNTIFKRTKTNEANQLTLLNRLQAIKDYLGKEKLSPNTISQSGRIKMAADLYARDGELKREQFREIAERFKASKVKQDGRVYANVSLMKDYINSYNLKELYDLDIEIE